MLEPNYLVSPVKLKPLKALPHSENEETGYCPRRMESGVFIPHDGTVPSTESVSSLLLNKINLFQTLFLPPSLRIYLFHNSKSSHSMSIEFSGVGPLFGVL